MPYSVVPLVLKYIYDAWSKKYENNFILLYTSLSPRAHRCANPDKPLENILELITLMTNWPQHALVFTQPYTTDKEGNLLFSDDELETSCRKDRLCKHIQVLQTRQYF